MSTEILDPHLAVFNSHVNNASDQADAEFIRTFGRAAWEEHIQPLHATGIMAIFDSPPTEHTRFWVYSVTNFVNEGKPDYTPLEV